MNNITLIPNIQLRDENGTVHPQAQVAILDVTINNSWSMSGGELGDVYTESESANGISYKVAYFVNPQAQVQGFPIKALLNYEDGVFSDVLTVDSELPDIQRILESNVSKKEKGIAIAKIALARRPK